MRSATLLSLSFLIVSGGSCLASDIKDRLADFFHVTPDRVQIECKQDSYELENGELKICLNRADHERRCEISVNGLAKAPAQNKISYEMNFSDATPYKEWQSVMQIHSFPDKGEAWRCPVTALEIQNGAFHMYNRWDAEKLSRTTGNNCTEPGSSISAREVLRDGKVTPGKWQTVELKATLSPEDGLFQFKLDDQSSPLLTGPNSYNDDRDPFLKFGIYKPTSWEEGHEKTCVKYRNVKIETDRN